MPWLEERTLTLFVRDTEVRRYEPGVRECGVDVERPSGPLMGSADIDADTDTDPDRALPLKAPIIHGHLIRQHSPYLFLSISISLNLFLPYLFILRSILFSDRPPWITGHCVSSRAPQQKTVHLSSFTTKPNRRYGTAWQSHIARLVIVHRASSPRSASPRRRDILGAPYDRNREKAQGSDAERASARARLPMHVRGWYRRERTHARARACQQLSGARTLAWTSCYEDRGSPFDRRDHADARGSQASQPASQTAKRPVRDRTTDWNGLYRVCNVSRAPTPSEGERQQEFRGRGARERARERAPSRGSRRPRPRHDALTNRVPRRLQTPTRPPTTPQPGQRAHSDAVLASRCTLFSPAGRPGSARSARAHRRDHGYLLAPPTTLPNQSAGRWGGATYTYAYGGFLESQGRRSQEADRGCHVRDWTFFGAVLR